MDKCYEIENYKNQLNKITNESNLSIGMIRYIIHDLYDYIDKLYEQISEQEQKELLQDKEKGIKEEDDKNEYQTSTSTD